MTFSLCISFRRLAALAWPDVVERVEYLGRQLDLEGVGVPSSGSRVRGLMIKALTAGFWGSQATYLEASADKLGVLDGHGDCEV
jgi:hypothetical protein